MKRVIKGATGKTLSVSYIKEQLFDYLCDADFLEIGGVPADKIVERIQKLGPVFDVDDVLQTAVEEGETVPSAISILEEEYESM